MNFQNPNVQPPGVTAPAVPMMMPQQYAAVPGQPPPNPAYRMYAMPNGYPAPQGSIPLQGGLLKSLCLSACVIFVGVYARKLSA